MKYSFPQAFQKVLEYFPRVCSSAFVLDTFILLLGIFNLLQMGILQCI